MFTAVTFELTTAKGGFNIAVEKHHPNIWKLLRFLHEEQAAMEVTGQQIVAGLVVLRAEQEIRHHSETSCCSEESVRSGADKHGILLNRRLRQPR